MSRLSRTASTSSPSLACRRPSRAAPASFESTTSSAFRRIRWMMRTRLSQSIGISGREIREHTLDAVGRMGGDEFLVILPMTTAEEAIAFISRVQGSVAALERSHPEFGRPSLSMGIAEAPRHGASPSTLLAGADSALYRAKRGGRNAVEVAEDM